MPLRAAMVLLCMCVLMCSCNGGRDRLDNMTVSELASAFRDYNATPDAPDYDPQDKLRLAKALVARGAFSKAMTENDTKAMLGSMPPELEDAYRGAYREKGHDIVTVSYSLHPAAGLRLKFVDGQLASWEISVDDGSD